MPEGIQPRRQGDVPLEDQLANTPENVAGIAKYQRLVIYCILGQIGLFILNIVANAMAQSNPNVGGLFGLVLLVAGLALIGLMLFSVFKLATSLGMGAGVAVLLAVLCFLPLISLIVLLVLSSKATTRLKAAGVPVGLLGADTSKLPT